MDKRYPCGGVSRRRWLAASAFSAASVPLIAALEAKAGAGGPSPIGQTTHQGGDGKPLSKLAIPGLYPGRVIEVKNPRMIRDGKKDREAIRASMDQGIQALTGATDAVEGWKHFIEPGDVVGIKVVPNAQPFAHSSFEIVLEVIEKLKVCGVKTGDIFVFDRYRGEFMQAGYDKILPDGVRWGGLDPVGNQFQLDFPDHAHDPVAGFDRDAFVWMDLIPYGDDPKDERLYRSHLGRLVTRTVNKIVAIPVIKDHASAGVTGALKNMSHGTVNNVDRSHQHAVHQRLQSVHPAGRLPPDHPREVRPPDHGRDPQGSTTVGRSHGTAASARGSTTRSSSPPTRWRWTTSSGRSSTPVARRATCRRWPPPARQRSTR